MKNMSKKLLSMALVIAMVLSLMPMSFADGGEEAGKVAENLTISYRTMDLVDTSMKKTEGKTGEFKDAINYTKTNDFFEFINDSINDGYHNKYGITDIGLNFFRYYNGGWIIFKIYVPVAGEYKIKTNNNVKNDGSMLSAHIFPTTVAPNASALSGQYQVGQIDCLKSETNKSGGWTGTAAAGYNVTVDTAFFFTDTGLQSGTPATYNFTDAGEYYIGFKAGTNRVYFSNFYLVSGDGSGYALIGDMTITPDAVKAGGSAHATATAYKSNDGSLATVTYACTDAGVDVDSESGAISISKDCKPGKKTITATDGSAVNSISKELVVTSANASDVTVTYDFMKNAVMGGTTPHAELYTYETTNGFFRYVFDATEDKKFGWERKFVNNTLQLAENRYEIFEIDVPVAGDYDVKINYATDVLGNDMNVYLFKSNGEEKITHTAFTDERKIGVVDCYDKTDTSESVSPTVHTEPKNLGSYPFEKGKYYFAVQAIDNTGDASYKYAFISGLTLDGGNGDALMPCFDGNTTLRTNETATLSGYLSSTGAAANVTYESTNSGVATVVDGTITAVAPGKTTVTMTATDSTVVDAAKTYSVEITVPDADLQTAFNAAPEAADDYIAPTVVGLGFDGEVLKAKNNGNGTFTLTAAATKGEDEKFLYWAVGNTDKKRIISFNNVINDYVPAGEGRNYLIAVYEDDVSADTAEYYNQNGQRIATGAVGGEKPALPSMAGYGEAKSWEQYGKTNIYVAQYGDAPQLGNVKVTVVGGDGTATVPFGGSVTCTATGENFKCWTKSGINGKEEIVSVDKNYTFNAWEDCTVTATYTTHTPLSTAMKIIIDSFTAGKETGVMAEFIGLDNAVEKGIIWKTNTAETKIAMTTTDNQFTVIADKAGEYIGYAILKDGDAYSIITDGLVSVSAAE